MLTASIFFLSQKGCCGLLTWGRVAAVAVVTDRALVPTRMDRRDPRQGARKGTFGPRAALRKKKVS